MKKPIYYPYFRGKQFELITIREKAELMASVGICPIIEPVKKSLKNLENTLKTLREKECSNILIANPKVGDYASEPVGKILQGLNSNDYTTTTIGIIFQGTDEDQDALSYLTQLNDWPICIIHREIVDDDSIKQISALNDRIREHIFIPITILPRTYQKQFSNSKRILIMDGFKKRNRNKDYPDQETFSDLHTIYTEVGQDGFGDFLTVGDNYSESGGPAHSVAIHLTYFDLKKSKVMKICHFKSDRSDTPTDTGGKYLEALGKLVAFVEDKESPVLKTLAYQEFKSHLEMNSYPGLGYIKKLSMMHHVETLAAFLMKE